MKSVTKFKLLFIIIIFAIISSSCNTDIESPLEEIQQEEKPIEEEKPLTPLNGGTLSLGAFTPTHLNPIISQEEDGYHILKLIFESLITLDDEHRPKPLLAEDWAIENNGETIIFNLRKNVTWQDGEPFIAKDVAFTLDVLKSKDVDSPYSQYVKNVKSYKILDEHKVEINLLGNQSGNLEVFIFPIIPSHRYKKPKDVMTANKWTPIGTGYYKLNKYIQGREITLELNNDYWGKLPYIENINIGLMGKKDQIVKTFETKGIDILRAMDNNWSHFTEDESLAIYPYNTQKYKFIAINHEREIFKNRNIRKAIQLSLDRQDMLEELYLSQGRIVDIPIPPHSWLYDKDISTLSYNLNDSKRLVSESGWEKLLDDDEGEGGNNKTKKEKKQDKKKNKLEFELLVKGGDQLRIQEAQMIKKSIEAIGINVNIKELSSEKINESIKKKDFDAILTGWDLSFIPDLTFAFHSEEIDEGQNFISYRNNTINKLLNEASRHKTEEEREKVYSDLQSKLSEDLPYINLYFKSSALIVNKRIKGPISPTDYNIFNNIEEWFIKYK